MARPMGKGSTLGIHNLSDKAAVLAPETRFFERAEYSYRWKASH